MDIDESVSEPIASTSASQGAAFRRTTNARPNNHELDGNSLLSMSQVYAFFMRNLGANEQVGDDELNSDSDEPDYEGTDSTNVCRVWADQAD